MNQAAYLFLAGFSFGITFSAFTIVPIMSELARTAWYFYGRADEMQFPKAWPAECRAPRLARWMYHDGIERLIARLVKATHDRHPQ